MTRGGIHGEILPEPEENCDTSSIVLPGKAILEELIFRIALAAGPVFPRKL